MGLERGQRGVLVGSIDLIRSAIRAGQFKRRHLVDPLYGDRCCNALKTVGVDAGRVVVPAGEASKDLKYVQDLYDKAFKAGLDRSSVVVALGGGVVGDLAGFVAATFLRGIKLIQVPTSLLSVIEQESRNIPNSPRTAPRNKRLSS